MSSQIFAVGNAAEHPGSPCNPYSYQAVQQALKVLAKKDGNPDYLDVKLDEEHSLIELSEKPARELK